MITEEFTSADGLVTVDYMRGRVQAEKTNNIHCHPYYELLVVIKGVITYSDNKGVTIIGDKGAVFSKAYDVHNPYVKYPHPYERYRIRFEKSFFDSVLCGSDEIEKIISSSYKKNLSDEDFMELLLAVKNLYAVMKKENGNKLSECVYLTASLIKASEAKNRATESDENYISEVIECIKTEYGKRLTAEALAARFFVSRGKLLYDFKAYCNMTLLEYITLTRIDAAKELLLKGYSVSAASDECGFSSSSYFIKVFSAIADMTPLKFQMKFLRK